MGYLQNRKQDIWERLSKLLWVERLAGLVDGVNLRGTILEVKKDVLLRRVISKVENTAYGVI